MQDRFKERKIRRLTTLGHAPVAERAIRTIKASYYERMEKNNTGKGWEAI